MLYKTGDLRLTRKGSLAMGTVREAERELVYT